METERIYYCADCTMTHRGLPICGGTIGSDLAAGYCRLCGCGGVYAGYIARSEAERLGIVIPSLKELAAGN